MFVVFGIWTPIQLTHFYLGISTVTSQCQYFTHQSRTRCCHGKPSTCENYFKPIILYFLWGDYEISTQSPPLLGIALTRWGIFWSVFTVRLHAILKSLKSLWRRPVCSPHVKPIRQNHKSLYGVFLHLITRRWTFPGYMKRGWSLVCGRSGSASPDQYSAKL